MALRDAPAYPPGPFPLPPHVAHVKHINFLPVTTMTVYASIEVARATEEHGCRQDVAGTPGHVRGRAPGR